MTYAKCPGCGGPIFAQQYDWARRIGQVRLVSAWDMTFHCTKGCGWGMSIPCHEDGELLLDDE